MSEFEFDGEAERRKLEAMIRDDVIQRYRGVVDATGTIGPALLELRKRLQHPEDPATQPHFLAEGKPLVTAVEMPSVFSAGRGVVHGANFGPQTRVALRFLADDDSQYLAEVPAVLVGPARMEFELPEGLSGDVCVLLVEQPIAEAPELRLRACNDEELYEIEQQQFDSASDEEE